MEDASFLSFICKVGIICFLSNMYFRNIASKGDLCGWDWKDRDSTFGVWNSTDEKIYYKHCMKSDHPNVVLCPEEGLLTTKANNISFYADEDGNPIIEKDFMYQSKVVKSLR